ncbi:hypothetical protein BJ742DRAFT_849434 [Cladochytrium replicatum]|nr:hypothetical protein BJ742DRAFT_849434 [Cladochytrium replicatum]
MSSGFGLNGGRNRCFTFFQEFMKCYTQADTREECRLQFEDYQECLYHRKERAREKKERYDRVLSQWPIKLAASKSKGRHVVAKHDLEAGTTVISDTGTSFALFKYFTDELCLRCLRTLPIRKHTHVCKGCAKQTYYCSQPCQDADSLRHAFECAAVRQLPGISGMHSVDYALLRLLVGVLAQKALEEEQTKVFAAVSEASASPTSFVFVRELLAHRNACKKEWLEAVTKAAEDLREDAGVERSVDELVTLACQINSNSHGVTDANVAPRGEQKQTDENEERSASKKDKKESRESGKGLLGSGGGAPSVSSNTTIGVGMFPLASMLNHSCIPNCSYVVESVYTGLEQDEMRGAAAVRMVVRTNRAVKEGEELCLSYVDLMLPKQERRFELLKSKNFWCNCERCEATISLESTPSDSSEELITNARTAAEIDLFLNAIVCARCRVDVYVPVVHEDPNEPYNCRHCLHELPKSIHDTFQENAAREVESAFEFMGAGQAALAASAILRYLRTYDFGSCGPNAFLFGSTPFPPQCSSADPVTADHLRFHPNHHTTFNALPVLMNCGTRAGDFRLALACSERIVGIMQRTRIHGSDGEVGGWHEYAEHALFLSELAEIRAMVIREGLESGSGADPFMVWEGSIGGIEDGDAGECEAMAVKWRERAVKSLGLVYGTEHPKTLAAAMT